MTQERRNPLKRSWPRRLPRTLNLIAGMPEMPHFFELHSLQTAALGRTGR
jgi:hypothetical protein